MKKISVGVVAEFSAAGQVIPRSVIWTDGRVYPIESVLDKRTARTDQTLFRYTVRSYGQDAYLYRRGDRWFMDGTD